MIDGGKVFLKAMKIEDIPEICKLLQSNSARMISDSFGETLDIEKKTKSLRYILKSKNINELHFLVYSTKSKKVIGYTYLANINWKNNSAELAVIVNDKYKGIGYGSIINVTIINYCFNELNLNKVYSKIRTDNENIPERIEGQIIRKSLNKNDSTLNTYRGYYYKEWIKKQWNENELIINFNNIMNRYKLK